MLPDADSRAASPRYLGSWPLSFAVFGSQAWGRTGCSTSGHLVAQMQDVASGHLSLLVHLFSEELAISVSGDKTCSGSGSPIVNMEQLQVTGKAFPLD